MANTILLTIHEKLPEMSQTEQQLGDYILNHAEQVVRFSIAELAQESGVSQATIVRFAKHLSLDGFKTLKVELAGINNDETPLYEEVAPTDTLDVIKQKLALRTQHSIETTNQQLEDETLDQAVNLLQKAKVIHVYGLGASDLVAQDVTQKFSRVGKVTINSQDTHQMAVNLLLPDRPQVMVLISNSGQTVETVKLGQLAVQQQIPVIALTTNPKSSLGQLASLVLLTDGTESHSKVRSAATTSLLSQLYVIDLIYYRYLQQDYTANVSNLTASSELVGKFFRQSK
ncbi:MurR/RpiR family transcriptional regulator [Lacticaseibacillus brantae]|nr:MurR/RpiR family transcriptional regulator [Lacticaseibacillus brantae]